MPISIISAFLYYLGIPWDMKCRPAQERLPPNVPGSQDAEFTQRATIGSSAAGTTRWNVISIGYSGTQIPLCACLHAFPFVMRKLFPSGLAGVQVGLLGDWSWCTLVDNLSSPLEQDFACFHMPKFFWKKTLLNDTMTVTALPDWSWNLAKR